MAYTTPITAVTDAVATAADWNAGVRDNFASTYTVRARKATEKDVTTGTVDLLNGEFTVAANAVGSTGAIRLSAHGTITNSTGSTQTVQFDIVLGGSTLGTVTLSLQTHGTPRAWFLQAVISARNATNSQACAGHVGIATQTGVNPAYQQAFGSGSSWGAKDMTASQTLVLNATNSSGSMSTKLEFATMEVLP